MARHRLARLVLAGLVLAAVGGAAPASESESEGEFVPPNVILSTQKQPVYPPAAFKARYEGSVMLEMTVTDKGEVGDIKVLKCTRPKVGFEEATTRALKQWRFEPGTKNGVPVEVTTRFTLNFTRVGVGGKATPQVSAGSFSTLEDVSEADDRVATTERTTAAPSPARERR